MNRGLVAVLTGDVVGSSKLDAAERMSLHDLLQEASSQLRRKLGQEVPYDIDIFRGDSWQLLLAAPSRALMVGLYLKAMVRAGFDRPRLDTRVAIGIGTVEGIAGDNVSSGHGEAFLLSGDALEALAGGRRMAVALAESLDGRLAPALDALVAAIDALARRWTRRQAFAVGLALTGLTQEKIARQWIDGEISQQAVAKHLDRAGWNVIRSAITQFERSLREGDSHNSNKL